VVKGEIETVARALYDAQECCRGWEREPELLRARFRKAAHAAIEAVDRHRCIAPIIVAGDIRNACDYLLNSPDVSTLSVPNWPACRVVLQGPKFTIDAANDAFVRATGRDGFIGLPSHEAFPELREQGYLQLLEQVYHTRRSFTGLMMPILFQSSKGAPLEEHVTDFVYRPIVNADGDASGVFIESYDRTEAARA
jgi:PAS domain-containing protein